MEFRIGGQRREITREDIFDATRKREPEVGTMRNKYFLRLHRREYPIKQVIALVTGLRRGQFISHEAYRILTKLGFDISDRSLPGAASADTAADGGEALKLLVVFETDADGWHVANCPTLPGCRSQGRTRDEARANIREAIRAYVESMRGHGDPIPTSTEFDVVQVSV